MDGIGVDNGGTTLFPTSRIKAVFEGNGVSGRARRGNDPVVFHEISVTLAIPQAGKRHPVVRRVSNDHHGPGAA